MQVERGSEYPRVAIVAESSPTESNSASLTISGLFARWPRDRLFPVFASGSFDSQFADSHLRVNPWLWNPVGRMSRFAPRRFVLRSREVPGDLPIARGACAGVGAIGCLRTARALSELLPQLETRSVARFLSERGTEVIYTPIGGSIRIASLVSTLSRRLCIPVVPHFFDDWPSTLYSRRTLDALPRLALRRQMRRVLKRSPLCLAIGPEMASEFQRRLGRDIDWAMRPLKASEVDSADDGADPDFDLVYAGGLHLDRWRPLEEVARCAQLLGLTMGVFAPPEDLALSRDWLGRYSNVTASSVSPAEVARSLRRGKMVVHVESFDQAVQKYTRLSVSTKLPQCLGSGRPMVGYGPSEQASMQTIRRSGGGLTAHSPQRLRDVVSSMALSSRLRSDLAIRGRDYARMHFTEQTLAERLRQVLVSACVKQTVS
jgi:hypothetical protein